MVGADSISDLNLAYPPEFGKIEFYVKIKIAEMDSAPMDTGITQPDIQKIKDRI